MIMMIWFIYIDKFGQIFKNLIIFLYKEYCIKYIFDRSGIASAFKFIPFLTQLSISFFASSKLLLSMQFFKVVTSIPLRSQTCLRTGKVEQNLSDSQPIYHFFKID